MQYRELWHDPGFMEMVIDYVEAHFTRCEDWRFDEAMSNPAGLASEAHKIAGSAGMYGFNLLGDAARALEEAVRGSSPDYVIHRLFQDLKQNVRQAREEARAFAADTA